MNNFEQMVQQIDGAMDEGAYFVQQGNLREALPRFLAVQRALEPLQVQMAQAGDVSIELQNFIAMKLATCLNSIGVVYQARGNLEQALIYFRRALKIMEVIDSYSTETAVGLNNVGYIYDLQGDPEQALSYYRRALKIDEDIDSYSAETAACLNNIGTIYELQDDLEQAFIYFRRALAINEDAAPYSIETAGYLNNIGGVCHRHGDLEQVLICFSRALAINEAAAPNSPETATSLNNIGYVYQAQGDLKQALAFFDKAVAVRESLRERATDRQSRETMGGMDETLTPYWFALSVRNRRRATSDAAEAFRIGEMLRARILTERLAEHRYEPKTDDEARLLAQWRTVQGRYDQKYILRQQADRNPTASQEYRDQAHTAANAAKQEQDTLWKRVEADIPAFAALVRPAKALTLTEVQSRVLDPGTLLLSYTFFEGNFVAWAVRQNEIVWLDVEAKGAMEALATLRDAAASREGVTKLPDAAVDAARTLEAMLLPPQESPLWNGVTRVLVAPDGLLYYLPFELLPRLGDLPITYISSATTLDEMRRRDNQTPVSGAFLGFGDPDSGSMTRDNGGRFDVNRLPQARLEAARLGEMHETRALGGVGEVTVYTDKAATKNRALDGMGRFRRLHFAMHGQFDSDDPFASFLLFAPDENNADAPNEEKLLTARELLGLKLNADLVVCSACETGLGGLQNGEGLMGLSRAFLAAGARCLVVSLWRVDDRATRLFMERFYDYLEGRTVEQALLLTRQRMRDGIWSHPYYWAGFVAYGIATDTHPAAA